MKTSLSCPDCNFTCTSHQNLRIHFQQTNHKPYSGTMQNPRGVTRRAYHKEDPALTNPGTLPDSFRRNLNTLKDYMDRPDREPLIGLEYILEYKVYLRPEKVDTKYYCEICDLDCAIIPMVEHLIGMKHKKLYLMKDYPYVLQSPSAKKEDRNQFLKRMATEIEQEEGLKMYKADPVVRKVPIMNVMASEAKQLKRKSRWDIEGTREARMKKALEYLESFEIDTATEAATVTKLTQKLTEELKLYSNKLQEEALFPARVAKAKNLAMTLTQNKGKPVKKLPSLMSITPPAAPSENVKNKMGTPIIIPPPASFPQPPPFFPGNPGPNFQAVPGPFPPNPQQFFPANPQQNIPQMPPPFPQMAMFPPTFPGIPQQNIQPMPGAFPQMPQQIPANPIMQVPPASTQKNEADTDVNAEDIKFFKKLMALLSVLPQDDTPNSSQLSKLSTLKSLFVGKTPNTDSSANQQLMMQVASLTQDMESTQNMSMNQQLASKNTADMTQMNQNVMQMASVAQNVMPMENDQANQDSLIQLAALLKDRQKSRTIPAGTNSLPPSNQSFQNQEYGQNDNLMAMDQSIYQNTYMEPQTEHPSTSQNYGNVGYDASMSGNYNMSKRQHGGDAPSRATPSSYSKERESDMYSTEYENYAAEPPSYTRGSMTPRAAGAGKEKLQGASSALKRKEMRPGLGMRSSRSFDDPEWAGKESAMPYGKRGRMDQDPSYHAEGRSHHSKEDQAGKMEISADLLKKIRGKDLFTVSAILSEYADTSK